MALHTDPHFIVWLKDHYLRQMPVLAWNRRWLGMPEKPKRRRHWTQIGNTLRIWDHICLVILAWPIASHRTLPMGSASNVRWLHNRTREGSIRDPSHQGLFIPILKSMEITSTIRLLFARNISSLYRLQLNSVVTACKTFRSLLDPLLLTWFNFNPSMYK